MNGDKGGRKKKEKSKKQRASKQAPKGQAGKEPSEVADVDCQPQNASQELAAEACVFEASGAP